MSLSARHSAAIALAVALVVLAGCSPQSGPASPTRPVARPGGAEGYVFSDLSKGSAERDVDMTTHRGVVLGRVESAPAGASALANTKAELFAAPSGENVAGSAAATAMTDGKGFARFADVAPGRYRLRVGAAEFPLLVFSGSVSRWGAYPVGRGRAFELARQRVGDVIQPEVTFVASPPTPLPAGVTVSPALGNDDGAVDRGLEHSVARPQWFVYVDPFSDMKFQHPTRFVFVDAESGEVTVREASSWPLVNGLSYYGDPDTNIDSADRLVTPARRAAVPREVASAFAPRFLRPLPDHVPGCTSSTTYALLIQGSDEGPARADMSNIKSMFGRGGIPPALVYEWKPTSGLSPTAEVQAKWSRIKAAATPCDHLFVYLTAHGNRNGTAQLDTDGTNKDGSPKVYEAFSLKNLDWGNCKACHITIIIDTCYAGKQLNDLKAMLQPLTGRKVTIMASSDARHEAGSYPWWNPKGATGSAFTNELVPAFTARASAGGPSPLARAFDDANTAVASTAFTKAIREQNPQYWERVLAPGETCAALTGTPTPGVATQTPNVPPTTAPPTPTPTQANRPPVLRSFSAVLSPPETRYTVAATDADGDALTYEWSRTSSCGTFTGTGATAVWSHPHPPCPQEPDHPGAITVIVRDGKGGEARYTYPRGSSSGQTTF